MRFLLRRTSAAGLRHQLHLPKEASRHSPASSWLSATCGNREIHENIGDETAPRRRRERGADPSPPCERVFQMVTSVVTYDTCRRWRSCQADAIESRPKSIGGLYTYRVFVFIAKPLYTQFGSRSLQSCCDRLSSACKAVASTILKVERMDFSTQLVTTSQNSFRGIHTS